MLTYDGKAWLLTRLREFEEDEHERQEAFIEDMATELGSTYREVKEQIRRFG